MSIRTQLSYNVYQNFSNEFIKLNIDRNLLLNLSRDSKDVRTRLHKGRKGSDLCNVILAGASCNLALWIKQVIGNKPQPYWMKTNE